MPPLGDCSVIVALDGSRDNLCSFTVVALAVEGSGGQPRHSDGNSEHRVGDAVLVALLWIGAASAALLLYWGSKLTFFLDDWEFLLYRPGFTANSILAPHGEHIAVAPILIYKALLATFGMSSALPFRVVSISLFLVSAALLFVYLNRRVGQWPALAATAVVLFLGAAWEDLLWAFQMGYFGSMAAGLGALLTLERQDRRGDVATAVLLSVSVLFSSLGLPFLVGAAVAVLLQGERLRRLYVFVIPGALYVLWWLGWGHTAETAFSLSNVLKSPAFLFTGVGAAFSSLLGLLNPAVTKSHTIEIARLLAGVGIALAAWRMYRIGLRRINPRLWMVLAIAFSFWILAGFNQMPGRAPEVSRYQYIGAILVLLIAAELLQGIRLSRNGSLAAIAIIFLAAGASLVSNIEYLHDAYADGYHPISQLERSALGAIDIADATVEDQFVLSEELADTAYVHVEAGPYLRARDSYGSPGYSPSEIAASPEATRFSADKVLSGALRIALKPAANPPPEVRPVAARIGGDGLVIIPSDACVTVRSSGAESPLLRIPRGGVMLHAGMNPISDVHLARFSTGAEFPIDMAGNVAAGATAEIRIPPDHAPQPWKMQLETAGTTVVCGIGSGA
jgi:hypothetical protein